MVHVNAKKPTNSPTINKISTMIKNQLLSGMQKINNLVHMNHQQRKKKYKLLVNIYIYIYMFNP